MLVQVLRAKIHGATVTEAELEYEGSLTLDEDLMDAAGLFPNERVQVLNLNNGDRSETYLIRGKAGSGTVCLNGPLARRGQVGDRIIILAYGWVHVDQVEDWQPRIVLLGEGNKLVSVTPLD